MSARNLFYRQIHGGQYTLGGLSQATYPVQHHGTDIFEKLPNPFQATRYHSLIVDRGTLPRTLEVTAETAEGEIMGLRHREFPIHGVQFHPESVLTGEGMALLRNFLNAR